MNFDGLLTHMVRCAQGESKARNMSRQLWGTTTHLYDNLPRVRLQQPRHKPQRGGLAGAGAACRWRRKLSAPG